MDEIGFPEFLRNWRRSQAMRQIQLARLLGVSQGTVSKWERGEELPSAFKIQDIMEFITSRNGRDPFAVDRAFIRMQTDIRALFTYEGARLIGVSQGLRAQWPEFATLIGKEMRQHLVAETRLLYTDADLAERIKARDVAIIIGVSSRHVDLAVDHPIKHRWILAFRAYSGQLLGEVVYYPLEADAPERIERVIAVADIPDA
jgi:transcriptional regulator with XRE-family HTH domain